MPKLPVIKTRELANILKKLGFYLHHQTGSHAQYKNMKGERITVPVHAGKDLNKKTLKGIIDDLGISVEEFIKIMKNN